jgi:hypothetical protein
MFLASKKCFVLKTSEENMVVVSVQNAVECALPLNFRLVGLYGSPKKFMQVDENMGF